MFAVCLALPFLYAPLPSENGTREGRRPSDLDRFQGEWCVTSYEEEGVSHPSDVLKGWHLTFAGSAAESTRTDGSKTSGRIRLDSFRSPREIDLVWREGKQKETTVLAIYRFESDQLRICIGWRSDLRPTGFASSRALGTSVMVLQKAVRKGRPEQAAIRVVTPNQGHVAHS